MALIALLSGSVLGAFAAISGWLVFGISPMFGFGLYLATSLGLGLAPFVLCGLRTALRGVGNPIPANR
ncbi:hypothetical protein Q4543_01830 [Salipiger sp. 1_MG-2023]|uniref:hypothetical protein n=1 Tax=Salipiger sp. 1_MG-2023 TaxID=3062665 RepID=UPI0026E27976|nr:hypothetical protein [Salipiger sp. 1_MG-2023]MDO6584246.1 hypothetical protein [Salipiger sp. 1_MG-2023]